jgi:excinuclease ABC subunit A
MGPEGGDGGGEVVAEGSVAFVMAQKASPTGVFLKKRFQELVTV